jgi:peptidoglycan/xylan/chitin deacetylase (PgdA/CDA1 family)
MGDVALSFDNGPDAAVTPMVLEVLARRGVKASFFVLGKNLVHAERMKLAQRAAAEGHRIGNHSYTHRIPLGEDPGADAVDSEIAKTEQLIGALAETPKLFRPFGGGGKIGPHLLSRTAVDHLVANRYTCVLWNCVPEDWIDQDAWVDRALLDASTRPHTLVVMHDVLPRAMSHLDRFIGALLDAGHCITREFSAECVPIERGEVVRDISGFVSPPRAGGG